MSEISVSKFFNDGNFIRRANSYFNPALSFTRCFWFQQDATVPPVGNNFRQFFAYGDDNEVDPYIYVGSDTNTNNLFIQVWDGATAFNSNKVLPKPNVWLFCVLTYDSTTHILSLYLEGQLVCQLTFNLSTLIFVQKNDIIGGSYNKFFIGEVRGWQAVLSSAELTIERRNYLAQRQTNLLDDTPLSTIVGSTGVYLRDESGNNRGWTLTGTIVRATGPFTEGGGVILTLPTAAFDNPTDTTPTSLTPLSGYQGPNHLYSLNDTGLLPPEDGIVIVGVFTNFTSHSTGSNQLDATGFSKRQFNGGTILENQAIGGTDANGVTDWGAQNPVTTVGRSSNVPTDPDIIEPTTLQQWSRARVFLVAWGGRANWYNGNTLFTFTTRPYVWDSVTGGVQYITITAPSIVSPPIITTTGNLKVIKVVSPGTNATIFDFTTTGLSPATFSLANGQEQDFNGLTIGSGYQVFEVADPLFTTIYSIDNTNITILAGITTILTVTNTFLGPFSGIYYIKPNKTNDTLYYAIGYAYSNYHPTVVTEIVPIPNPYAIQ